MKRLENCSRGSSYNAVDWSCKPFADSPYGPRHIVSANADGMFLRMKVCMVVLGLLGKDSDVAEIQEHALNEGRSPNDVRSAMEKLARHQCVIRIGKGATCMYRLTPMGIVHFENYKNDFLWVHHGPPSRAY